ncbi:hypothetical protein Plec18170_006531 [Paecilomyces lecythidis]
MGTSTEKTDYLPGFTRLNHKAFLYVPKGANGETLNGIQSQTQRGAGPPPTLIYLSTWMNAQDRHIAKFVEYYQKLYPSSPILLAKSTSADFFFNSSSRQRQELAPAVATVRAYDARDRESNTQGGGILVHALSNGGSGHISLTSQLYFKETGQPLPMKALILDSTPGKARIVDGAVTLTHNAPRAWYILWPLRLFFAIFVAVFYVLPDMLGWESLASMNWRILNSRDPEYLASDAVRSYIYSDGDTDMRAMDIEAHAREATAAGIRVIEQENFHDTVHVAHMRHDPERYWGVVQQTWLAAHKG